MRCVQKLTHSSIAVLGNKFHDARVITVLISMYQRGRGKLVEELISRGQGLTTERVLGKTPATALNYL
eukprot:scaffold179638_cov19-Tisochrysis_lutea.AAC.2